jgi:hemerythrin-like domain-containing protein
MSATNPIDVRDMAIVHATFRNTYSESAVLVRANPTPSPERVTFLADHIDFGIMMLHHHHESEDELLYPKMIERAPEQAAMINEVEHQHQDVAASIERAQQACATWRDQPSPGSGEDLSAALESLNSMLQPHLDDEERLIVPLASTTLTKQEWDAMGEHARSTIPRSMLPIAMGMLLEPLNDADRAYMKAQLPAPIRLLFPLLIERPWRRYAQKLRSGV